MNQSYARHLNYTSVNEDWRTEVEGLKLRPGDRVLCPTGSGVRPLALLAAEDVRLTAIDFAPAQNHLLRLLIAALQELSVEDAMGFVGLHDRPAAERLNRLVCLHLPEATRAFWTAHRKKIARGVLYQGRFEQRFQQQARMIRRFRGKTVQELFAFDDIERQRAFVQTKWDTRTWRSVSRLALNPLVLRLTGADPAYYTNTAEPPRVMLYRTMLAGLNRHVAKDNFMLSLALTGRLPESDLPPHLRADGIARIQPRLRNLEIVDAEVVAYLKSPDAPRFDRYSLSDVCSYMNTSEFSDLIHAVVESAVPGGRFVLRQFLTRYEVPPELTSRLAREPALEKRLAAEDRSIGYEFIIAEVAGQ
ncbi:MAG TPA: DUF3419 family protein [bacterium]|nr:DUF3419 family protein [bacterium]